MEGYKSCKRVCVKFLEIVHMLILCCMPFHQQMLQMSLHMVLMYDNSFLIYLNIDLTIPQVPWADMYSAKQSAIGNSINAIKAEWHCDEHGTYFVNGNSNHIELNRFCLKAWGYF